MSGLFTSNQTFPVDSVKPSGRTTSKPQQARETPPPTEPAHRSLTSSCDYMANVQEAVELYLEVLRDEGKRIPEDVRTGKVKVAA